MQPSSRHVAGPRRIPAWAALALMIGLGAAMPGCRGATPAGRGEPSGPPAFRFENRQAQSGITFRHRSTPDSAKQFKMNHYDHGSGLLVADIDNDGLLDIYFLNQFGPNALYRNLGAGKFQDITDASGAGLGEKVSVGGSFADIDNDGYQDLFVTTVRGGNVLLHNNGDGTFTDITNGSGLEYSGHSSGAVFFDFDNDGLLDLLVVNVGRYTTEQRGERGYYVGRERAFQLYLNGGNEEPSLLYKNLGNGKFKDVTKQMGLETRGWHGDAAITDYNNDGYPDLYLCNMNGDDQFFENVGGQSFKEVTRAVFPKTSWGTMSAKFFDYNNDSLIDLMTTDMHSDMIANFTEDEKDRKVPLSRVFPAVVGVQNNLLGNSFYKNLGDGRYQEISDAIGVETYWPWGLSVDDLDADGYQDIFVSSGMGYPYPYGKDYLLMNQNGQTFKKAELELRAEPRAAGNIINDVFDIDCNHADKNRPECQAGFNDGPSCRIDHVCYRNGFVTGSRSSRSSAIFDLDNDGDLDIVTNEFNDAPQILLSNLAQRNTIHYLKIQLVGTRSNRNAIGARVEITTHGKKQVRYVDGKSGYLSQSQIPLYFGLGDADHVERIEVLWPSGQRQSMTAGSGIDQLLNITEPPSLSNAER